MAGHNLTIQWNYNLEGQSVLVAYISNVTSNWTVAFRKNNDSNTTVKLALQKRFIAGMLDSRA